MVNSVLEKKFNFGEVSPGKFYRSAQPDSEFLRYLRAQYGIKTIVVLRTDIDQVEKEFCEANSISLIQLPMKSWRRWPESEEIKSFLALIEDANSYPALIHCLGGKDRTSAMVAFYRLGCQKWLLKDAVEEMKSWRANWFWKLYIQTSAGKILAGFKEKSVFLLYLKRFLNVIFAFEGLIFALKNEKNFKMFLMFEAIMTGVLFWRGTALVEVGILLLGFGILNAMEIINSAIERLCDFVQPKFDIRIKVVKDLLACAITLVGFVIFIIWLLFVLF